MKKVLIISYAFPPQNEIASRRFSEMVPFFEKNEWLPYILTTNSTGDLPTNILENSIFRAGYHPGLRLKTSNNTILNLITRLRRNIGFHVRVFGPQLFQWSNLILKDKELIAKLKNESFNVIVASFGPPCALRLGHKLAKQLGVPVIYDFRDLGALHEGGDFIQNYFAKQIDSFYEKKYIRNAAALTTVSYGLAEKLQEVYNLKTEVIYNGWARQCDSAVRPSSSFGEEPYIYYAGRFYQHRLDPIFCLLQGLKDSGYYLVIRSLGPKYMESEIMNKATQCGVKKQVKLLPPASAETIHSEQLNAAVNLVVEDLSTQYKTIKGVLTGKFLQLLVYEAPVLAIARPDSEIGMILNLTNKGKLVSSIEELNAFFNGLKQQNDFVANEKVNDFSKEQQAKRLCLLLDEAYSASA